MSIVKEQDQKRPREVPTVLKKPINQIDNPKDRARNALLQACKLDPNKTQADFARNINMSTSAVNKILVNKDSHPMSINFAKALSEYVGVSLDDIFGDESVYALANKSGPAIEPPEASEDIYENSVKALTEYVDRLNIPIRRRRINYLAEFVAEKLEMASGSPDDYQHAITSVLANEAMKQG